MAARAPTDFTSYIDENDLIARKQVTFTSPSAIHNDQVFIHKKEELLFSDCHAPLLLLPGEGTWTTMRELNVVHDLCGTAAQDTCQFTLLCWASAAANFDVALYHVGDAARYTYNVVANQMSEIWRAWTNITIDSDGTVNRIYVQVDQHATATIYVGGLGLFTGT
jgi:hypothetical protein